MQLVELMSLILLTIFVTSLVSVDFARRYALRRNILDLPNSRSSHAAPTPRGGGAGMVVSFVAALCTLALFHLLDAKTAWTWILACCAVAGIGWLDDRRQLSARRRLVVHGLAAVFVIALLGGLPQQQLTRWGLGEYWVGSGFAVLVLVWGTNLFNFMDGIDGIAASEAIFVSAAGACLNWIGGGNSGMTAALLSLSAAAAGFLVWNWPPARIFMGDVGSGFLGFAVTALAVVTSQRGNAPIEVWPILGGVFLVDATVTLLRRLWRRERWMEPHRMHAYQHLVRRLGGHREVTRISIGINVGWLFPWACLANHFPHYAQACLVAALVPLVVAALAFGAGLPEKKTVR
jgi:Fuc2NAc and GlcNAc transferase